MRDSPAAPVGQRARRRRPNPRLVKIHRSYTVEEVARLFDVHRNTVRHWLKSGLPACDDRRPMLVLGRHLVAFLEDLRTRNKRACGPGQIFCVRCRMPKAPAEGMVDYVPSTATLGSLLAICPDCGSLMHRRVSLAKLSLAAGHLRVTLPQALLHIGDSQQPIVNSDFGQEAAHGHAQP